MIDIVLHQEWIDRAQALENEILERVKGRPNYTGLVVEGRYRLGYLGEFAVAHWLRHLKPEHRIVTDGRSQPSEIVCSGKRIEVKTSSTRYDDFLMAASQSLDFDYAVGCQLRNSESGGRFIRIHGWLTRYEVASLPQRTFKILSRYTPYSEMHPPESLWRKLEMERTQQRLREMFAEDLHRFCDIDNLDELSADAEDELRAYMLAAWVAGYTWRGLERCHVCGNQIGIDPPSEKPYSGGEGSRSPAPGAGPT